MFDLPLFISPAYAADTSPPASPNFLVIILILIGLGKCSSIAKRPTTSSTCVYALATALTGFLFISLQPLLKDSVLSSRLSIILFGMVFIIIELAAICLAVISLIDYKYHPEYVQGKKQAVWSLVLSGLLLLIFCSGIITAVLKTGNDGIASPTGVSKPGIRTFEDLNFSFVIPPEYVDMDKTLVNESASLVLAKSRPRTFFTIIAEALGEDLNLSNDTLKGISQSYLKGTDKDAKIFNEHPFEINGMNGTMYYSSVTINHATFSYVHWVFTRHGYGYQLIAWTDKKNEAKIHKDSNILFKGFNQLEPDKVCLSPSKKPFGPFTSPRFNYTIDLQNTAWSQWPDRQTTFPESETGALINNGSAFIIIPVSYDKKPHMDALIQGLMKAMDLSYPSTLVSDIQPFQTGNTDGLVCHYQDGDYTYRIKIIAGQKQALLVSAWTWDGSSPAPLFDQVLSRLVIDPDMDTISEQPFSDREKKNQATFMNRFGLFYHETKQYEKSLGFFKTALDYNPENDRYFLNCLKTLSQLDMYAEGVAMIESYPPGYEKNPSIASWYAWFLHNTGHSDKAISVYQAMFEKDYRHDGDFTDYIYLLSSLHRWDEADAAFERYFQKGESIDLRIEQARCLSKQNRFDEAITILTTLQKNIPFHSAIAYALIDNYSKSNQLTTAHTLCKELISKGYDSAHAYYTQGEVEYDLKRYKEAKASFEKALTFSPDDEDTKQYLQQVTALLGEGNNSSIKHVIEPVPLPALIRNAVQALPTDTGGTGYDAYYIHMMEGFAFTRGKELKRTLYRKIHILNTGGVDKFSSLEFDFNPLSETVYVNTLDVLDQNGKRIAKGNPSDYYVIDKQADSMATFDQTLNITVPHLSPGNIIDLVVTIKKKDKPDYLPFFERSLSSSRPVLYSCVFYTGSPDDIRFHEAHVNKPVKTDKGMAWIMKNPTPYHFEPLQVDYEQIVPLVTFTDASNSWKTEGLNYLKDIDSKLCSDKQTASLAKSLTKACTTRKEKIEALVSYIQKNYTYKALEFGRRAWSPNTPATVIKNKYGDCKDHAVLLYQLLKEIHIPSYLTLVSTDTIIEESLPSMDQFNHMILFVPDPKGAGQFIDATDKDIDPQMTVPPGTGGHMALILDQENIQLKQIPDYPPGSSVVSNICDILVDHQTNSMKINETLTLSGYSADFMRNHLKTIEQIKQPRWVKQILSDYLKEETELLTFSTDHVDANSQDLVLRLSYTMACPPINNARGFQCTVPAIWEKYYLETSPVNTRTTPFQIHYPFELKSDITVKSLSGMTPTTAIPGHQKKTHDFGGWESHVRPRDNAYDMSFNVNFNPGTYPAERYKEYCTMVNDAVKTLGGTVMFKPTEPKVSTQ